MPEKKSAESALEKARQIIRQSGGIIRTSKAVRTGIHPCTLCQLRDNVLLEVLSVPVN